MLTRTAAGRSKSGDDPWLAEAKPAAPCLEYLSDTDHNTQYITLDAFPFRLGRADDASFTIACSQISREHAEISRSSGGLYIRDLKSTNGTFLNGLRIQDETLASGDIIHLAHREFRFVYQSDRIPTRSVTTTLFMHGGLPLSVLHGRPHLEELLRQRLVRTLFQPIVDMDTKVTLGYEALGRGAQGNLSAWPHDLFRLADRCGTAGELSRVLRVSAAAEARRLPGGAALFCNVCPAELSEPGFFDSLRQLRESVSGVRPLVVEIHEDTIADLSTLRRLHGQLRALGIRLAFDDFGSGQARLAELVDVTPDYVKLDMKLIRNIHQSTQRQTLLRSISQMARDLRIHVIAEGIEVTEEAEVCRDLGCHYGQGYLFGHPGAPPPFSDASDDTWRVELVPFQATPH